MIRTLLLLLIGYVAWTLYRIFQRSRSSGGGHDGVQSVRKSDKPKAGTPEVHDAKFEDIDPEK